MFIDLPSRQTGDFIQFRVPVRREEQCLFGFLLDSMEGLAVHSQVAGAEALDLQISPGRWKEFASFRQAWESFHAE